VPTSLAIIGPIWANAGLPWWAFLPWDLFAEPGGLEHAVIDHEQLHIDATPLTDEARVHIEATYEVDVDEAFATPLVFITTLPEVRSPTVTLDGTALALTRTDFVGEPPSWAPPYRSYDEEPTQELAFEVAMEPGRHELSVAYDAVIAGADHDHSGLLTWEVPYALAPARDWGGFGTLDVVVDLPPGWQADATPSLRRDGDQLAGHFDGLPADHLRLLLRAPVPLLGQVAWLLGPLVWLLWAATLPVGTLLLGRRAHTRGWRSWVLLPVTGLSAAGWVLLLLVATVFARSVRNLGLPVQQLADIGPSYLDLFLLTVVSVGGSVAALVAVASFHITLSLVRRAT